MQIPTYDSAPIAPNVLPTSQQSGNSPVAQALGGVGKALGGVSSEMIALLGQHKATADENVSMTAYLNYATGTDTLEDSFKTLKGKAAHEALDGVQAKHKELWDTTYNSLANDAQKQWFAQRTAPVQLQFAKNINTHLADSDAEMYTDNLKGMVTITSRKLRSNPSEDSYQFDPNSPGSLMNQHLSAVADMAHHAGFSGSLSDLDHSDPFFKDAVEKARNEEWTEHVKLLASKENGLPKALEFYKDHEGSIADSALGKALKEKQDAYRVDGMLEQIKLKLGTKPYEEFDIEKAYTIGKELASDPETRKLLYIELEREQHVHNQAATQRYDVAAGKMLKPALVAWGNHTKYSVSKIKQDPMYASLSEAQQDKLITRANTNNREVYEFNATLAQREIASVRETHARTKESGVEAQNKEAAYWFTHKEKLITLSPEALQNLNVTPADIKTLAADREKQVSEGALHTASVASGVVRAHLAKMPGLDSERLANYARAGQKMVDAVELTLGNSIDPADVENVVTLGMQQYSKTEQPGLWDNGKTHSTTATGFDAIKPKDYAAMIKAAHDRGIVLTPAQMHKLLQMKLDSEAGK